MITSDLIHINVVGDVEADLLFPLIDKYLPFSDRIANIRIIDNDQSNHHEPAYIDLVQDVEQGKLAIGYRLPVYYLTEEYYTAVVFNTLLGGGPDSMLFKRIREELNKVYFIGSSYDQYKGSLYIYAGIDASDKEDVVSEISTILGAIQAQEIADEALQIAKTALVQNLIESLDSIGAITSRINHLALFHRTFHQSELIEKIKRVTKEDIANIAKQISFDTLVMLRCESNE
jgi:predicted Zn-dependent peptidase